MREGRPQTILYRSEASVASALAQVLQSKGTTNGLSARAAIFQFLRLSLRVDVSGVQFQRGRQQANDEKAPSQATVGSWIGRDRHVIDALEREDPRNQLNKIEAIREALLVVYFASDDSSHLPEALRLAGIGHRHTVQRSQAEACFQEVVNAGPDLSLKAFAALPLGRPALTGPLSTSVQSASDPATEEPAPAIAQPVAKGLQVSSRYVVNLHSLKRRAVDGRAHVPAALLRSRAVKMAELQAATVVRRPRAGGTPGHSIVIVSGPIGIGKSELIMEWLIGLRDSAECPADEVLLMTHCALQAEDLVTEQVRSLMASDQDTALVVLDGLRVKNGSLQWNQRPRMPSSDLFALIKSQIGLRAFVCVLGIQTPSGSPDTLPRQWFENPSNAAIPAAEEIRLRPLPADESRVYAATFLDRRRLRKDQIETIASWSGGLPLLLSAVSALVNKKGDVYLPAQLDEIAGRGESDTWQQLRATLRQLNEFDGQHYATMRLLSLFRRPLQPRQIRSIVSAVRRAGLSIGRIDETGLADTLLRSPFCSVGPEGTVELHDGVHWIIEKDLNEAIRTDAVIAREVRTINLVASREFFARMVERNESLIGHHGSSASPRFDTQFDIELACDCAHHLLGAREDDKDRAAVAWTDEALATILPSAARHAMSGTASPQEIERFCLRTLLAGGGLEGSTFSSRGLFAHKLELLERFIQPWSNAPAEEADVKQMRRTVRFEYAACSIVAGYLRPAMGQLRLLLDELGSMEASQVAMFYGSSELKRQSHELRAMDFCQEAAKVGATLASALIRSGRLTEVLARLRQIQSQIIVPAMTWTSQPRRTPELTRQVRIKALRAHSRVLVRMAEATHLAAVPFLAAQTPGRDIDAALVLFEQAREHQAEIDLLTSSSPGEHSRQRGSQGVVGMLSGESSRAYVRCLLAHAQMLAHEPKQRDDLLEKAGLEVDCHLFAIAESPHSYGWSNDAIGFRLQKAIIEALKGRFESAQRQLRQVDENPKYQNLGAISLQMQFEVRLTKTKIALAQSSDNTLTPELVDDLAALEVHAGDTDHRLIQLEALLLLACGTRGPERLRFLAQARVVYEGCKGYRARDDVFRWLERGEVHGWQQLTIAA